MRESQTTAERYALDRSPDWRALRRHFELGEGFAFIVLLVPDAEGAEVCRAALARFLQERGQHLEVVSEAQPSELENIASTLLELKPPPDAGAVWVGKAVSEGEGDSGVWDKAWRLGVARLNQFRNPLQRAFGVPLIFVGAPRLQVILRENAPDLWSVRTLVAWVEPTLAESVAATS